MLCFFEDHGTKRLRRVQSSTIKGSTDALLMIRQNLVKHHFSCILPIDRSIHGRADESGDYRSHVLKNAGAGLKRWSLIHAHARM